MLTNNTRKRKPRNSAQQSSRSAQKRSRSAQKRRRISTKKSFVAPDPEVGRFYVLNPEPNGFRAL